jgi:hypothetical protein
VAVLRDDVGWYREVAMVRCLRCHAEFEIPRSLSAELRGEVIACANDAGRVLDAVTLLERRAHVSIRDAKGAVFHLALPGPTCRRCHAVVDVDPVTECGKCRSLVINWSECSTT